tara:strand:- start:60444 stop:61061 length:618 start_codon:yes stop_codon:yes gene_type:complete
MTGTPLRIAASLSLLLMLASCGSSPASHFYRLTPGSGALGNEQQPSLGVGPIEVPEFLNRSALVYTRGENRLLVSGTDLWGEPLAQGVQRILGLNLAQLLSTQNLSYFPWDSRHPPEYGVRVSVLDLDADEREATLTADWVLFRPATGDVISKRISQYTNPLQAGSFAPSNLPPAYSALLYRLSETIAAEIREEQRKSAKDQGEQ